MRSEKDKDFSRLQTAGLMGCTCGVWPMTLSTLCYFSSHSHPMAWVALQHLWDAGLWISRPPSMAPMHRCKDRNHRRTEGERKTWAGMRGRKGQAIKERRGPASEWNRVSCMPLTKGVRRPRLEAFGPPRVSLGPKEPDFLHKMGSTGAPCTCSEVLQKARNAMCH